MKSVKVEIANKEYNLTGDPGLIEKSRDMVNAHIAKLRMINGKQNTDDLSILVALNIAEEKIIFQQDIQKKLETSLDQIEKLTQFADSLHTDRVL